MLVTTKTNANPKFKLNIEQLNAFIANWSSVIAVKAHQFVGMKDEIFLSLLTLVMVGSVSSDEMISDHDPDNDQSSW